MDGRPIPVALFLETLANWHAAFEAGRLDEARRAADEIAEVGVMLATDPEFRALYRHSREDDDPDDPAAALCALRAFLGAVTDTGVPGAYRSGARRI